MASTQRRTALAFIAAFENMDVDASIAVRSPRCTHQILPTSLGIGTKNNEDFRKHLTGLMPLIDKFPVTPIDILESGNIVTIRATSEARFRPAIMDGHPDDWQYHGEYLFVFQMNEAGDKIDRILEFLDSTKVVDLRTLQQRARVNLAAQGN